jgi:cytidylate kinase
MSTHIVAIDGPAGAGKSTIATMVADELGFQLIDTGALYRTVAYLAMEQGADLEDADAVAAIAAGLDLEFRREDGDNVLYCNGEPLRGEIRTEDVGRGASVISSHPEVRDALMGAQRDMGEARSSVLEGRDIGTVVFPNADVKIFLTADPKVRATRRVEQLEERGEDVDFDEVYRDIVARDKRDRERDVAPLKQAEDAVCVDTSDLSIDEVVRKILGIVEGHRS